MRVCVSLLLYGIITIAGSAGAQSSAPRRSNGFSVHPAAYETSPNLALTYERRIAKAVTLGLTSQLGLLSRRRHRSRGDVAFPKGATSGSCAACTTHGPPLDRRRLLNESRDRTSGPVTACCASDRQLKVSASAGTRTRTGLPTSS